MTSSTRTGRQLTDEVLQSAGQAVDATRGLAHDTADKVRDLRRDIEPAVDQWSSRVHDAAQRGLDALAHGSARARDSFVRGTDAAGRMVADQPMKSVLVAAAVGAAITALILVAARRR
ncbi:hypothetical protein ACO2Q9_05230 [Variovorax sp. VNK109]|jgi:ElaB/YqjD/DUF883 family membrane-anchored ribosome-binding protein|uniref:hypothetical protein n=1 Tax=Variovorax sp. VNK109 TaxID=3400919 RepID=UPI003C0C64B4